MEKTADPLSNVDTTWLRMEDPTNLMVITGLLSLDEPIDPDRLRAVIEKRLLKYPRFRQRVVSQHGRPYWETDPHFALDHHLQVLELPPPATRQSLQKIVSELMSTPLPMDRPLWHVYVLRGLEDQCWLLVRLHHAIADGFALMEVMLSLTDDSAEPRTNGKGNGNGKSNGKNHPAVASAAQSSGAEKPSSPRPSFVVRAVRSAAALGRLIVLPSDPHSPFKGPLGVPKQAVWSAPIPLEQVKQIGRIVGATVNDVLLAAISGALRYYLEQHHVPVPTPLEMRAIMPVNLRRKATSGQLGNGFGLVFVGLPVGMTDPTHRLQEIERRTSKIKDSPEAVVVLTVLATLGLTTPGIQNLAVNIFGKKGTAVITNVPGPREMRYLAGKPLRSVLFWVPQSGHLGLGISIFSYAGQVTVGVATDKNLVPDPELLIQGFHRSFQELLRTVEVDSDLPLHPSPTYHAPN